MNHRRLAKPSRSRSQLLLLLGLAILTQCFFILLAVVMHTQADTRAFLQIHTRAHMRAHREGKWVVNDKKGVGKERRLTVTLTSLRLYIQNCFPFVALQGRV